MKNPRTISVAEIIRNATFTVDTLHLFELYLAQLENLTVTLPENLIDPSDIPRHQNGRLHEDRVLKFFEASVWILQALAMQESRIGKVRMYEQATAIAQALWTPLREVFAFTACEIKIGPPQQMATVSVTDADHILN